MKNGLHMILACLPSWTFSCSFHQGDNLTFCHIHLDPLKTGLSLKRKFLSEKIWQSFRRVAFLICPIYLYFNDKIALFIVNTLFLPPSQHGTILKSWSTISDLSQSNTNTRAKKHVRKHHRVRYKEIKNIKIFFFFFKFLL